MKKNIKSSDYLALLGHWLKSALSRVSAFPPRPGLEFYGTGYNNWGVQTHQKALAAFAVLASDPGLDEKAAGLEREQIVEHALKLFRFSMESHIEGGWHCTDGEKWGHTWISTLGLERMMHGVEAIYPRLGEDDIRLMRKVFISESNWLLDEYHRGPATGIPGEILAGKVINNFPENNLWSGAFLHRTAMMFPDAPRADEYREKGTRFLVNSISVASDALSGKIIEGRPVSERYAGDNFFESFALNHHGYLNVGYMVICLSNTAMLHFSFKAKGLPPPESLYHHAEDLWKLVKLCTFPDGRLLRIGGDTRVRYCYCQDYLIPVLLLACDRFNDTGCPLLEKEWLAKISAETEYNADGSFLSKRCSELGKISPLYYTRLESDRAAAISMGAYWRRIFDIPDRNCSENLPASTGSWSDDYHGAYLERTENRIASWVWRAGEPPQGLCLPPGDSSLAEWKQNLAGEIRGTGKLNFQEVGFHAGKRFSGGFITWGQTLFRSECMVAEGQSDEVVAVQNLVFAAAPDGQTVLGIQKASAPGRRVYLRSLKGVFLRIPNDVFNGGRRTYFSREGKLELEGPPLAGETIKLRSRWLNVENRLSLIIASGPGEICIYRHGFRQVGIKRFPAEENMPPGGMLYADEICSPCITGLRPFNPCAVIYEAAFVLKSGISSETTALLAEEGEIFQPPAPAGTGALVSPGRDGNMYLLCANFAAEPSELEFALGERLLDISSGRSILADSSGKLKLQLGGREAGLFLVGR